MLDSPAEVDRCATLETAAARLPTGFAGHIARIDSGNGSKQQC